MKRLKIFLNGAYFIILGAVVFNQNRNSSKITWRHAKVMEQPISEARLPIGAALLSSYVSRSVVFDLLFSTLQSLAMADETVRNVWDVIGFPNNADRVPIQDREQSL